MTSLVAVLAFGILLCGKDYQSGTLLALFATGLILARFFLRVQLVVWRGMAIGFALGAFSCWCDYAYRDVVPSDRLFDIMLSAIWHSVFGGLLALTVWRIRRGAG